MTELLERVPAANARRENREPEFAQMKAQKEEALGRILAPQRAYTKVIRAALPEDGIVPGAVPQAMLYQPFRLKTKRVEPNAKWLSPGRAECTLAPDPLTRAG